MTTGTFLPVFIGCPWLAWSNGAAPACSSATAWMARL